MKMKPNIILGGVLVISTFILASCSDKSNPAASVPTSSTNIEATGTQHIDSGTQNSGMKDMHVEGEVNNHFEATQITINSTCPKRHKDLGKTEKPINGHMGPLCKKIPSIKISKRKCDKKGMAIYNKNLCVMAWESDQNYFRVRYIR